MITRLGVRSIIGALAVSAPLVSAQVHGRPATPAAPLAKTDPNQRYADAWRAWDAGKYDIALASLAEILKAPGTDALLPRIAELTGEQYRTVLVSDLLQGTAQWRPRWSSDGAHIAYSVTGPGGPRTILARV
jgi:hypothetical protein